MYWFYAKGEGLMDKIEFEEWMLKGVHEGRGIKVLKEGEEGVQEKIEVSAIVVWAGSWVSTRSVHSGLAIDFG
jgi:hypothetical protein